MFITGKNAQGSPVPGAQITHATQCPRSQVSFNLFLKMQKCFFYSSESRAPLQAEAPGSKASEMGADAFNSLNRDFPIPKTNVPTREQTPQHYPRAPMLCSHQPRACVSFWTQVALASKCRDPHCCVQALEIWIVFLLEISIIMFSLCSPDRLELEKKSKAAECWQGERRSSSVKSRFLGNLEGNKRENEWHT